MAKILIKNGTVWDGERFFWGDVLTENQYIAKIAGEITEEADFVYDATDQIVSAGLVDLHVHMRGASSDNIGIQAEMSSFPFGVTAVNDAGSTKGDEALLASYMVKNTVFVRVKTKDNHADLSNIDVRLYQYGTRAIGLKMSFDTCTANVWDITPVREVCDFAKSRGLKVMIHCTNSPTAMSTIVSTLNRGDILTHVYHGGENPCTDYQFECFYIAKRRGVIMDVGFAGHVHTDFANFKSAVQVGFVPKTISTDITCLSAFKRGGRYGMTMCMSIAEELGMTREEVFLACTSNAAKVLGKEAEWGYLKEGRVADIAVLEYADEGYDLTDKAGNRVQSENGYRCVLTVADGQVVYRYR